VTYQKGQFLDQVYLQQDAFDPVDISTSMARQQRVFKQLRRCLTELPTFEQKSQAREYFVQLTNLFRNLNYSAENTPDFRRFWEQIESHAGQAVSL